MSQVEDLAQQLSSLVIAREAPPSAGVPIWLKGILATLLIAAAIGGTAYLTRDRWNLKTAETTPILLIQPGLTAPIFVAAGTIVAPKTATVAPRTPGRLIKVLVQEGGLVEEGATVALLESTDQALALGQAKADVGASEARFAAAQVAVKGATIRRGRAQELAEGGANSKSSLEDAALDLAGSNAQIQVSKADIASAHSRLEIARKNLDATVLRAPFRGTVLHVLAQPGEFVPTAPNQGVIQLADLSTLEIDAEVSETNLGRVALDMPVEIRLDVANGTGLAGQVFSIRPHVDPGKATAVVKIRLQRPADFKSALYPGMNGRVSFLTQPPDLAALKMPPRLEVPASAVVHEGGKARILTVDKEGVVSAVEIKVGGTDLDRIVLTSGPPAGTLVINEPEGIQSGDRIRLYAEK